MFWIYTYTVCYKLIVTNVCDFDRLSSFKFYVCNYGIALKAAIIPCNMNRIEKSTYDYLMTVFGGTNKYYIFLEDSKYMCETIEDQFSLIKLF